MIRDFSEMARNELYTQIDEVTPDGIWEEVMDGVSDLGLNIQSWLGILSIANYVNDIKGYHRKILDKNNISKIQLDAIFQEIKDIDETYTSILAMLNEEFCKDIAYLKELANIIRVGQGIGVRQACLTLKTQAESRGDIFIKALYSMWANGLQIPIQEQYYRRIEEYMYQEIAGLGRDVSQLNHDHDKKRQEGVVEVYRRLYPESAQKFKDLFDSAQGDGFSEFDRVNIIYIAISADEPGRTLFLDSIDTFSFRHVDGSASSQYVYGENKIDLNSADSLYDCPKGPYNTFFHETGHAIDYQAGGGAYFSRSYEQGANNEMICQDVYTVIGDRVDNVSTQMNIQLTTDMKENILNAVRNQDEASLSATESIIYQEVKKQLNKELSSASSTAFFQNPGTGKQEGVKIYAGISDVYGGVTNNLIVGDRAHWSKDSQGRYTYWYIPDTNPPETTHNQEVEMWAHYFSFTMTGNTEAINSMNAYLPGTMKQYDQMLKDMQIQVEKENEES